MKSNLYYDGKLSHLYAIWFRNLILKIFTLYLYSPWAKTRLRRYIYKNISLFGDRLEYTGTGAELFKGLIKVWIFLFLVSLVIHLFAAFSELTDTGPVIKTLGQILKDYSFPLLLLCLIYYGQFAALHYRLTRTSWRGIRSRLEGKPKSYMLFQIKRLLINFCTLGYTIGRSDLMAREYLVQRTFIGNQACTANYNLKALDRINLITLLLAIPTLGFSRFWYKAALLRYQWNHMKIGTVHFKATYHTGDVLFFTLGNVFMLILTLGFATPIVINRIVTFFVKNVEVLGNVEGSTILQVPADAKATGESIIDAMDYDGIDFDFGFF